MGTKFYGNKNVTDTLTSMIDSGRVAHAFLLFGENGLGKKTLVAAFASKIITNDFTPTVINPMAHPDIIWVQHSGAKQGFSVENLRDLCVDAYIMPNSCDKKVYILADCDNISVPAQNTLLKIIEEPPEFTYFIFTSQSKSVFLPTILSRVISLGLLECSDKDCREALSKHGYTDVGQIEDAVLSFPGNIGMCLNYIKETELKNAVQTVKDIIDSICSRNEYLLLRAFVYIENNRFITKTVLYMLDKVVRDSCIEGITISRNIGCYTEGSKKLSETYSTKKIIKIHEILNDAVYALDCNVNMNIELSAVCGKIADI